MYGLCFITNAFPKQGMSHAGATNPGACSFSEASPEAGRAGREWREDTPLGAQDGPTRFSGGKVALCFCVGVGLGPSTPESPVGRNRKVLAEIGRPTRRMRGRRPMARWGSAATNGAGGPQFLSRGSASARRASTVWICLASASVMVKVQPSRVNHSPFCGT